MYEVTSRKGGQRQQPYGRPCATVREVRDNSRTAMDLLNLHVHRLQKKQPAGPTAKRKQQQSRWLHSLRRVVRGEGGEEGAKSGVFYF